MNRRRTIVFGIAALALIVGAWLLFGPSNEPKYEGQTVSFWFRQYYSSKSGRETEYDSSEAGDALQKMGTNALPFLVSGALSTNEDSAFKIKYYELLGKLPESWGMHKLISRDDIRNSAMGAISYNHFPASFILPLLTNALKEPTTPQFKQAIHILAYATNGLESVAPYFAKALHDSNLELRMRSLFFLNHLGPAASAAMPDLIDLLKSSRNQNIHLDTIIVLGSIGHDAAPATPYLIDMFEKETNWWLRGIVACSLCQIDRQQNTALNFFMDGLKEKNAPDTSSAATEYPFPVFFFNDVDEAWHGDNDRSRFAGTELGLIGSNAFPAIPALMKALNETSDSYELFVFADALKRVGASGELVSPILKQKLTSGDDLIRLEAAHLILDIAPGDREAQSLLIDMLRNPKYKKNVILNLRQTGTNAIADAIPALMAVFDESQPDNWFDAATALRNIHAPKDLIMAKLKEKLKSSDDGIQLSIDAALLDFDSTDRDAIANLIRLVKKKSPEMEYVIDALGAAGPAAKEAIPVLKEALKDKDKVIRMLARSALRKIEKKNPE